MANVNIMSKVALPYAEALLNLAQYNNAIEKTNEDLSYISRILSESKDLQLFLENPLVVQSAKKNVLNKLFLNHISKNILKFLAVLVERRRIPILKNVIAKYFELSYKLESTVVAEITTAITFNETQKDSLTTKLKHVTASKQVNLVMKLDPSLIAGFTVKIGSKIIDTSLSGKLKQMALHLKGT
uniref:ATP synthase subunit delta n=1 Tax=Gastroclonium compressum TaxID=1852973 RepID=A0A173G011_GASCM|nr:ATP synthase subunit delta [Coeloseira compressa]ANH09609.1 ATP synthase subunit delta [Coeloseira compressa]